MKKNTLIMAGLVFALASCQKDENSGTNGVNSSENKTTQTITNTIPITFTTKVLAEELAGKNYGDVPQSSEILEQIAANYPDQVYIASIHNNDNLEASAADQITSNLAGGSTPSYSESMMNRQSLGGSRFVNYTDYQAAIQLLLATPADCGIAINSTISGSTVTVDVYSSFNYTSSTTHTMNVYIVEDMITDVTGSLAQSNNFNGNKLSSFYQMGNPITGYTHNNVVRRILTPVMGDPIKPSSITPGGMSTQSYTFDLPSTVNKNNCSVVAFVTTVNSNGIADNVLNVQKGKLGTMKTWN